jgi:hypothetical protein
MTLFGIARNGHRDLGFPLYKTKIDRDNKLREENKFTWNFQNEMNLNLSSAKSFTVLAILTDDDRYFLLNEIPKESVQE